MNRRLRHYVCGSTSHDLAAMFRGAPRERRRFPSGVFLYDGENGRRVLFDTGYATGEWRTGWRGSVYRRLLPPRVDDEDDVAARLREDGVDPASVTHVVLSHLHPDHVGGVRRFPGATFVVSEGMLRTLATPTLRSGVLTGLLPEWFGDAAVRVLCDDEFSSREVGGVEIFAVDLFGDDQYLLVDLPGHADGHLGALVDGRVLLAGDAAWGSDLLPKAQRLRAVPRAVQFDADAYLRTARTVSLLADAGVNVVCSHDPLRERDLLD
ncbi:MBL fold metallo-hydrolase [Microbacterium hydrocarbonoxydans]|uniref:MBL fold metallo-hydrolase n=1 Tax=Microbacterium hydrocarbonoxydans TaxID=273678 RepID=UPI00203A8DD6|nr:MBL fold metallo-hydrolase [Microbacterium hydrocarbonoxydans]MCM3780452.1 MBL fold metallo-hydrolase [Microbacterium hydrocarbonoxydans]